VTKNPLKLTTKELESSFGLNAYDFGARMQDMQLGRWFSVDPMADKFYSESPYVYAGNNPVKFVDIGGMYKVDEATAREYPIIQIMAEKYLPLLAQNKEIKAAFLNNLEGKMTSKQFDEMVKSGSGPTIEMTEGSNRYDPLYPDKIFISTTLLGAAQDALGKAQKTGDGTDLMTSMFETSLGVLHESSHKKADELNVRDQESSTNIAEYERGLSFESLAFGRNSTTTVSRSTGITIRDPDKVKGLALKNYGTPKAFGMTISGYLNNSIDRSKLKIPLSTNSNQ
jgi:RHS repeat-associated protein